MTNKIKCLRNFSFASAILGTLGAIVVFGTGVYLMVYPETNILVTSSIGKEKNDSEPQYLNVTYEDKNGEKEVIQIAIDRTEEVTEKLNADLKVFISTIAGIILLLIGIVFIVEGILSSVAILKKEKHLIISHLVLISISLLIGLIMFVWDPNYKTVILVIVLLIRVCFVVKYLDTLKKMNRVDGTETEVPAISAKF
ncbi:hypothetical protein CHUAL_001295 [Chamberlinius hualienensis]